MTKRIKVTGGRAREVHSTSRPSRGIDPKSVGDVLDAEQLGADVGFGGVHPALSSLRRDVLAALRSSGGRPGLEGAVRRQKIPMMDADWYELERVANSFQASGVKASPGQIAGKLLHDAISVLKVSPVKYPTAGQAANLRISETTTTRSARQRSRKKPSKV